MQTEPWNADLLDYLATYLVENGYDLKKTLAHIATSQAYQSHAQIVTKETDDHGYTYAGPRAKRLTAEQFVDAIWQLTGAAPTKMDASVLRGKVDPALAKQITVKGQWIWGDSAKPGSTPPSGESITLRKTFKLDADPASASAVITCDNGFTLFVNNKQDQRRGGLEQTRRCAAANRAQERGELDHRHRHQCRQRAERRRILLRRPHSRCRRQGNLDHHRCVVGMERSSARRQGRPHGSL
jgi:hypothetical protein